jgi:putative ABC transport system ATP-binding protein
MSNCILQATDLRRTYALTDSKVQALRGVSLTVSAGDFVAVMGPSGCGKSTLLQLCGGMDRADGGVLEFEGRDVASLTDSELTRLRRERIGFVFQFFNLLPTLSIGENIALPLLLAKVPESTAMARASEIAGRVGISHRLGHSPAQVSGGEAQRAAIARAVVHEPGLLIADEPTGSLDSENGEAVMDLIRELNRDLGVTVLLATHDAKVGAAAGRLVRMRDGGIVD